MNRALDVTSDIPTIPLPRAQIVEGTPATGARTLTKFAGTEVGVWEMTPGIATDVEVDEAFVVLAGSATVTVEGGERIELVPGSVVRLCKNDRTTWAVHETLRKLYVV